MATKAGGELTDPLATTKMPGVKPVLSPHSQVDNSTSSVEASVALDEISKLGRFGWCEIAGVFLPTIFRSQNQSFVSVRMVERMLLSRFLQVLPNEIVTCPTIHSYRTTEVEARLLNEINAKHADCQYGKENFTTKDLVVKRSDIDRFYQYLDLCNRKMITKKSTEKDRCGFLRIGGSSDVRYTEVEGVKYLPLFYFEGEEIDSQKCKTLRGWDWAFLRFCCRVQGVKDELIAGDCCGTVALEELKYYFPPGTSFVEYWPAKDLISRVVTKRNTQGSWTRVIINPERKKFQGRLTAIRDFPLQASSQAPYKAQKSLIEGKIVQCINIRPFQYKEVMVTLPHMVEALFPGLSEEQVGNMLASEGVLLYKGNSGQVEVIKREGWNDKYEEVPLVIVRDIVTNITNWKNAVKAGEVGSKRFKGI